RLPSIVKKVRKACLQAESDYKPRAYPGRVILFRSNHRPLGQVSDPCARWSEYAISGLEVYEIAGNHENILLEPQVRFVAEHLKACLDDAAVACHVSVARPSELNKDRQLTGSGLQEQSAIADSIERKGPNSRGRLSLTRILSFDPGRIQQKLIPWAMKGGLALLDQSIFSGSNFVMSILLA